MKRSKSTEAAAAASKNPRKWKKLTRLLFAFGALYLLSIAFKFRHFLQMSAVQSGGGDVDSDDDRPLFSSVYHETLNRKLNPDPTRDPPLKPIENQIEVRPRISYGRLTGEIMKRRQGYRYGWAGNLTMLERMASDAWILGSKAWEELKNYELVGNLSSVHLTGGKKMESCPSSVSMKGEKSVKMGSETEEIMLLPCGLEVGSSVTIIGVPQKAHREYVPELGRKWKGDELVMVSQFMVELQGLKAVDGEDPPKILHFNPRLKGDWSKMPVIELNTCYRMQWGKSMRCSGLLSDDDEDKVDGYNKCEKWVRSDNADAKESKSASWLNRFIGRAKKPEIIWPFPFVEGKLFVLTIRSGVEGYHIYVGGLHVTSFPYRPGFTLEDATGLSIKGNVGIHSVYATSLPKSHPSSSVQKVLEMSERWRSRPLPEGPIHLFIGILSATNHFAERMAIRKSWMQYPDFKASYAVARFFVALGPRKEVNAMLKKEAEYFRDVVILPFMDHYELVVLKTIAICEYGIRNVTAAYVMKCDDDTFVRLDVVLKEIKKVANERSLYMGNLNLYHRPLRTGKWAVTYEEWPENIYPPYANGPGYIISSDIASFIASKHANDSLRIFKMEDVSMGMWVEEFNSTNRVQYSHSWKFCQFGCIENYFTSHYQSPKQMTCLWDKLSRGQAHCCNLR